MEFKKPKPIFDELDEVVEAGELKAILNTGEVAELLAVAKTTVYKYVKEGKIKPRNLNNWQIEQQYQFDRADAELLKTKQQKKPGYSTGEAAKLIGCTTQTILKHIKEGTLAAEKMMYRGLNRNFISVAELARFKEIYSFSQKTHFIDKPALKCYLLQLYQYKKPANDPETDETDDASSVGELARIIELDDQGFGLLVTESEKLISLDQLSKNYQAVTEMKVKKNSVKKGYAILKLPKPKLLKSLTYNLIDFIQAEVGINNIKLAVTEETIILEIKPVFLPLNTQEHHDMIDCIKSYLVEGNVVVRDDAIFIDSDIEVIQTHINSKVKRKLEREAKQKEISVSELVKQILEERNTGLHTSD
jgi:DNA-binding transcriptional MerR regulator